MVPETGDKDAADRTATAKAPASAAAAASRAAAAAAAAGTVSGTAAAQVQGVERDPRVDGRRLRRGGHQLRPVHHRPRRHGCTGFDIILAVSEGYLGSLPTPHTPRTVLYLVTCLLDTDWCL